MVASAQALEMLDVERELKHWLNNNWDPGLGLMEWRRLLADSGWAAPSWPARWHGRGLPEWSSPLVRGGITAFGAVGVPLGSGTTLAGPTILTHGPDELRETFLAPLLTGEHTWCQLFSEPGAGSDIAGLSTRAVLDGDEWIVNGQKVWNTSAHYADYGLLLARTNWDAPKHRGITYFVLPMHQPGVEVRPLHQMNGHSSFNEVFLTDARVPARFVIGEVDKGWAAALTTLAFERQAGVIRPPAYRQDPGRTVTEARVEAEHVFETYRWYPQRAGRVDLLTTLAAATGRVQDPLTRQEMVKAISMQRAMDWTSARARAAHELGRPPGPEGSLGKLALSAIARQAAVAHSLIAGARGMLNGPDDLYEGLVAEILTSVPAQSIAGGTDEIQRNIIAEKVLGLPKDPSHDGNKPFRETLRNR